MQNCPYSTGFYLGALKKDHSNDGLYRSDCRFIASVLGWENGVACLRQRNHFKLGDTLEVLSPTLEPVEFKVTAITNEDGEAQETAPHPNQTVYVPCEIPLEAGDMLRRREEIVVK